MHASCMTSYKKCEPVSQCIHCWITDYHKIRKYADHPKCDQKWTLDLVEDNQPTLGKGMQSENNAVCMQSCYLC